jgi:hypothetical protein
MKSEMRFVDTTTRVIVTEHPTLNNNHCIEEGRMIVNILRDLLLRIPTQKLTLNVTSRGKIINYNCTTFCCPRLEIGDAENGCKVLQITDGTSRHNISPFDNINTLRKIYEYAIGLPY